MCSSNQRKGSVSETATAMKTANGSSGSSTPTIPRRGHFSGRSLHRKCSCVVVCLVLWGLFQYGKTTTIGAFLVRKIAQLTPMMLGIARAKWHGIHVPIVVEHPKCGRTWFKCIAGVMLGMELSMDSSTVEGASIDDLVLYAEQHAIWKHGRSSFDAQSTPAMLESTRELVSTYHTHTGILLVRDPRDTIISSFYQILYRQNRNHIIPEDATLQEYIYFEVASFSTYIAFLNEWAGFFTDPVASKGWKAVRYEDLRSEDTQLDTLRVVSDHLNLNLSDLDLQEAGGRCDFSRMKKETAGEQGKLGSTVGTGGGKAESAKVRNGKVGGYASELDAADVECLNFYMCKHLSEDAVRLFGYQGDCDASTVCDKWE